jgi:tape measure domain-containing protein
MSSNRDIRYSVSGDDQPFQAAMSRVAQSLEQLNATAARSSLRVEQAMKESAQQSENAWSQAAGKIKGVFIGLASIAAVKGLVDQADQAALLDARLKNVTGTMQAAGQASQELFTIAQRLQAPYQEVAGTFARILPMVQELKGGVREASALTEILITTAKLSGSSAQEAASAAQQFAQALGSGVLQGDELKSIMENNQALSRTLAESLGVPVGALKEMGKQGKLTAEVVSNALLGSFDKVKASAEGLPVTISGGMTRITNAMQAFMRATHDANGVLGVAAAVLVEVSKVIELVVARITSLGRENQKVSEGTKSMAALIGRSFAYVIDVLGALINNVRMVGGNISLMFAAISEGIKGNFSTAAMLLKTMTTDGIAAAEKFKKAISGTGESVLAYDGLKAGEGVTDREGRQGTKTSFAKLQGGAPKADAGGGSKDSSRMSEWSAQLEEMKVKFLESNAQFREYDKNDELKFWREKLSITKAGTAENFSVRSKVAQLDQAVRRAAFDAELASLRTQEEEVSKSAVAKLQIVERELELIKKTYGEDSKEFELAEKRKVKAVREALDQLRQIRDIEAATSDKRRMSETNETLNQAKLSASLGLITNAELLEQQRQFEASTNEIKKQGLLARQSLIDPEKDPVAAAQINAQLEELEIQYQGRLAEIRNQALVQSAAPMKSFMQQMETSWASIIGKLMQGSITIGKAMRMVFQSIASTIIQMLAQVLAKWLVTQVMMMVLGKQQAASTVVQSAGEAGAAGVASMAAAPWPLNMTAPVFGAAMSAAALAFAPVASASRGFDIPAGMNPITQLHQREMVLPAEHAETIRNMSGENGGSAVNINVTAMDAKSVAQLFRDNGSELVKAVRYAQRNGA